ncbi:hypothetical protein HRH25_13235 [Flavisolibacter sp. BT320]|nr:hypothetical protein [Flavisolibacter longurius]
MLLRLFLPLLTILFSFPVAGQEPGTDYIAIGNPPDTIRMHQQRLSTTTEKAKKIAAEISGFMTTPVFQQAFRALQDSLHTGQAKEFSVSFGRNNREDTILSDILSGGRSSAPIPAVQSAFADMHTHLRNTPPSSGDVYGLLERGARSPGYTRRFVLTASGTLYALFVMDTAAAAAFLQVYPPQRKAGYSPLFPTALLDEFRELLYGKMMVEATAMACILEKYRAGVLLFRQQEGEDLQWVKGCELELVPSVVPVIPDKL